MRFRSGLLVFVIVIVCITVGYATYTHLKQRPPHWLIELVTKTEPPPPLPAGDRAPLVAPIGFTATIYSRDVPGARVMIRDNKGTMLVSETSRGKVVALPDVNNDGKADSTKTVLDGLKQPHGLAVQCSSANTCTLYVAETGALKSYSYNADTQTATFQKTLTDLPVGEGHFTRTILTDSDGTHLLISIGSDCNVCNEVDSRRASIMLLDLTTGATSSYARGLRNSVFMAIDPIGKGVWATENGRDIMGDDIPPDEINIIRQGGDYGWPVCYGDNVHDTDFDRRGSDSACVGKVPPHISLQAHSAALGLAFIPKEGWPADMKNDLLVAYHGSWNRSVPTGYKVVRFDLDAARNASGGPIDFLTGFLADGAKTDTAIGRPVGLLAEAGGVVYVSDDRAGAIYRVAVTK